VYLLPFNRALHPDALIASGAETAGCVLATLLDAVDLGSRIN
jgi:nicotinamidase-related amidase